MKPFNKTTGKQVRLKEGEWAFQGDVCLFAEKLPDDFDSWPEVKDGIVALGEATGHAHKFEGEFELRENPKTKERHLRLVKPVQLFHQEHGYLEVETPKQVGIRIGIVREMDHFKEEERRILD